MSNPPNKHGLSRTIPDPIKREIRRACGFGCAICGLSLYHYEHVDPVFSEAHAHDPDDMCLLCPNHHDRVTRGLLPKDEILSAMQSPKALQEGFSHNNEFSLLRRPATVFLGQVEFMDPELMIVYEDDPLIWLSDDDGQLLLNGKFYDKKGSLILEIIENEWRHSVGNWDVEQIGKSLKVRESSGSISLTVTCEAPHILHFDYVNMYIGEHRFKSRKNKKIHIETASGAGFFENEEFRMKGPLVLRKDGGFEVTGPLMIKGGIIRGSRS